MCPYSKNQPCLRLLFAFLLTTLILFMLLPKAAAAETASLGDFSTLDALIEAQMQKHGLPGVAIAIVDGDEVVYSQGYGRAGRDRPMTAETQLFIGSQSKSFTALAVAQLADQSVLDLDAPVQAYIPWFRVADQAASEQITVRHLLNHSSGLSDAGFAVVLSRDTSLEAVVRSLESATLTAPVGSAFQYFNRGYTVLAYLVEISSGQSFDAYVRDQIMIPLGMDHSTADPQSAQAIAQGYSRLFGFNFPMGQPTPEYGTGAANMISTAEDLAKYAIAMKNHAEGLVSPRMGREIFTPVHGSYGFGWFVVEGGEKIFHGGADETFRTDVNLYPSEGRAFVLLINQGHQFDHFVSAVQLRDSVEAFVLGSDPTPVSQGWSVRWMGWGVGIITLGLSIMHVHNFIRLSSWRERTQNMSKSKRMTDVGISFLIPTVILIIVLSQVRAFYGDRFNLWPTLVGMPLIIPDVFILMLVAAIPDYVQGIFKIILWQKKPVP